MLTTRDATQLRNNSIVVLGAGGFVGRAVIDAAVAQGLNVVAIVRQSNAAVELEKRGVKALIGDAAQPVTWLTAADGATAVIDLIQPQIPHRLGERALQRIVRERATATAGIVAALQSLPAERRPLYVNVSGLADLDQDDRGVISHNSPLTKLPKGFGKIGTAVRRVVQQSRIDATFAHLGTVYGPGKSFADRVLPAVAKGRYPIFGSGTNHLSFVHVADAARALLHIATQSRMAARNRTWIIADHSQLTLESFLSQTAEALGAPRPRRLPRWVGHVLLGTGLMNELLKDAPSDSSDLETSGFRFRYPRFRDGISDTITALGYRAASKQNQELAYATAGRNAL